MSADPSVIAMTAWEFQAKRANQLDNQLNEARAALAGNGTAAAKLKAVKTVLDRDTQTFPDMPA